MADIHQSLTGDRPKILIEWEDIRYSVTIKNKETKVKEEKEILHGVNGFANPGQFLAIMGASGAGKTTLLNILSDRIAGGSSKISGTIKTNGQSVHDVDFGAYSAYVMQDDVLLDTMTPRESFQFSAKLRITGTPEEKAEKVEKLITDLKLSKCANSRIGSVLQRGISGGERKRTSIGVELITDPSILFLDEPTSGLDSYTALVVIQLMVHQAEQGRTILSTIHQPSSDIFNIFHRLLLLCDGRIIYQGAAKYSTDHFAAIPYAPFDEKEFVCPTYSNPADFFMEKMHVEKRDQKNEEETLRFQKFNDHYEASLETVNAERYNGDLPELTAGKETQASTSFFYQLMLLLLRSFRHSMRNPIMTKVKFGQTMVMVILIDILYYDIGTGDSSVQNRNGLLFFICINQLMLGVQSVVLTFPMERALFLREQANKMYGVVPYFAGKSISEVPNQVFFPTLFSVLIYWTVGLNDHDATKPLIFIGLTILTHFCGISLGLLTGCLFSDVQVAVTAAPMCVIPFMLFGGFLVNSDSIPVAFIWIEYISPFKYAFGAYVVNEYEDLDLDCEPICDPLDDLNLEPDTLWENTLILCSEVLGFRILGLIFLKLLVRKLGS